MVALLDVNRGAGLAPGAEGMIAPRCLPSATPDALHAGPAHHGVTLGAGGEPGLGPGTAERPLGTDPTGTIGRPTDTLVVLLLGTGPDAGHALTLRFGTVMNQLGTER